MRKITQFVKIAVARLLLVVVIFYGVNLLIWPLISDQVIAWFEAKIRGMYVP